MRITRQAVTLVLAGVAVFVAADMVWRFGSRPRADEALEVIESIAPADGTTLYAGSTVQFEITPIGGYAPDEVIVSLPFGRARAVGNPARVDILIPANVALGQVEVVFVPVQNGVAAIGRKGMYEIALAPTTAVSSVSMGDRIELMPKERRHVVVIAKFSDGHSRDVGMDDGLDIVVTDSAIGQVVRVRGEDGIDYLEVEARDYGRTSIMVVYRNQVATTTVEVGLGLLRGDLDGDGRIGAEDEGIIRAAFGRQANQEDPRDLNGDGVIDKLDLEVLKSLSCGTRANPSLIPGGKPGTGCIMEWSLAGDVLGAYQWAAETGWAAPNRSATARSCIWSAVAIVACVRIRDS